MTEKTSTPGLTQEEAQTRLKKDGYNEIPNFTQRSARGIMLEIIREPMFTLLAFGAVIYALVGDVTDAFMLIVLACFSIGITFTQEFRSEKIIDALRNLSAPRARVIREGVLQYIPSREIVAGDLLHYSEGDRVAADATLFEAQDLLVDESLLTGESVPVTKQLPSSIEPKDTKTSASHEPATLYAGSLIVKGSAQAFAYATGINTEFGKIGKSLSSIEIEPAKLKQQIRNLVKYAGFAGGSVAVLAALLSGLFRSTWLEALHAGIAIGMSMLPEEFPLVIAVFMAMGAWRISQIGVLTRRVSAIETLGSITVLCTDKTGTLTKNIMTVVAASSPLEKWVQGQAAHSSIENILAASLLASEKFPTDPMDMAIHQWTATHLPLTPPASQESSPLRLLHSFDLRPHFFAIIHVYTHKQNTTVSYYAKGAFESIALLCKLSPKEFQAQQKEVEALATQGVRVLAVAKQDSALWNNETDFKNTINNLQLDYCGLIGFSDLLREEAALAIENCKKAGIRVIMITGDHPTTALAIANHAGIHSTHCVSGDEIELSDKDTLNTLVSKSSVFARIRPNQKLRLVNCLKDQGEIIAMTGDGVNDAPAIRAAHVGIAMGRKGTEVAREAAALVLMDDNFDSIVKTIRLGRRIYDNLSKAIEYIIAVHIPIAGAALVPLFFDLPLILEPIHIAFLEMIIDPACSIVFEAEAAEKNVMLRPPRPQSASIISPLILRWSLIQGLAALLAVMTVLYIFCQKQLPEPELRALIFTQLVLLNIGLIFISRSFSPSLKSLNYKLNPLLWFLVSLVIGLLFTILYWKPAQQFFHFSAVHLEHLGLCLGVTGITIICLGSAKHKLAH